ncbi:hypothetical protein DUHN55_15200 [Helicobacter pylori]
MGTLPGMSETHDVPHGPFEPSPVPSDRDLLPGELPFTAWGQHPDGTLDLRVFDQGVWWVDAQQRPHRIAKLPPEYVANVIGYLEGHAEHFYIATLRRTVVEDGTDLLLGRLPANSVAEALGATSLADVSPDVWLASTPLVRALHARFAT